MGVLGWLSRSSSKQPEKSRSEIAIEKATALEADGKVSEAWDYLKRWLKTNPNHFELLLTGANLLIQLDRHEHAQECLKRASRKPPHTADAYLRLGYSYKWAKHFSNARKSLQYAMDLGADVHPYELEELREPAPAPRVELYSRPDVADRLVALEAALMDMGFEEEPYEEPPPVRLPEVTVEPVWDNAPEPAWEDAPEPAWVDTPSEPSLESEVDLPWEPHSDPTPEPVPEPKTRSDLGFDPFPEPAPRPAVARFPEPTVADISQQVGEIGELNQIGDAIEVLRKTEISGATKTRMLMDLRFRLDGLREDWEVEAIESVPEPAPPTEMEDSTFSELEIDRNLTFSNFITGPSNTSALSAARKVAENPGRVLNPLLISGVAGVGKTHFLHAVANRFANENRRVSLIDGPSFAKQFKREVHAGDHGMSELLQGRDVLLIDDFHLPPGQEEGLLAWFLNSAVEKHIAVVAAASDGLARLVELLRELDASPVLAEINPPNETEVRRFARGYSNHLGYQLTKGELKELIDSSPASYFSIREALRRD